VEKEKPLAMAPAQVALNNLSKSIKSNLSAVAVALLAVVILAASYFTAERMQSPQATLNRQIDVEVEKAKRMLNSYEPGGQLLVAAIDTANALTTQPSSEFPAEDRWPASLKTLQERLEASSTDIEPLRSEFRRLSGEESSKVSAPANYEQLKAKLDANLKLIREALTIVQGAVRMSSEEADGKSHPVATRLEAVLIYHQADLLRREAAMERDEATAARRRFDAIRSRWQTLQAEIVAIEAVAKGGVIGPASQPAGLAEAVAPSSPSTQPVAEAPTAEPAKQAAPAKPGVLHWVVGMARGKKAAKSAPTGVAEVPAAVESAPRPTVPAEIPPSAPTIVTLATPEERTAKLKSERENAVAAIAAAEADVARLREHKVTLERALAAAQKTARETQVRMMQLDEKGVDPVEPGAMDRFMSEYQKASQEYRAAIREAALLEKGGIRNARPGTQDDQEVLKAPLVAADSKQPMKPTEGLIAVSKELKAAEDQLEASKGWQTSVDAQIAAVARDQKAGSAKLASLRTAQSSLKEEAGKAIAKASAASAKADELALQAVKLLTGPGKQAAQNARTAASTQINDAKEKQQALTAENPRLTEIAKTGFLVGYAQSLEADLSLMAAYIQGERAADLQLQAQVLRIAEAMGIPADAKKPEPAYVYQPAAALAEADKARGEAITMARNAYELYRKSGSSLKNLWVLNANAGAVCELLSILQTGKEAKQSRDLAIQIYQQALQERKDRPEAEQYRVALEGLTRAGR
jgi:hypothetical protein